MIPLRDDVPTRRTPWMNYGIIATTAVVFFIQLAEREGQPSLAERFGMIPARVMHPDKIVEIPDFETRIVEEPVQTNRGIQIARVVERVPVWRPAAEAAVPPVLTLVTCIFLHGGWMHVLGNMWFLFIFGDNVEDRFGRWQYLLFYVACGAAASTSHLISDPGSPIPTIGASGAIAAVMGAYLVSYPHARVLAVVPIFVILYSVVLPAPVFLGIWFVMQFFEGVSSITSVQTTGVAWWAHIGGFAVGCCVTWWLDKTRWLQPRNQQISPVVRRYTRIPIRGVPRRDRWT